MFINNSSLYTIFDSGAPDIGISSLWYNAFVGQIFSKAIVFQEQRGNRLYADCDGNWPELYFMIDYHWV